MYGQAVIAVVLLSRQQGELLARLGVHKAARKSSAYRNRSDTRARDLRRGTAQRLLLGWFQGILTDVLSIPGASEKLQLAPRGAMQVWLNAFTQIVRESDLAPATARSKAEEAIVRIEGSLVLARVFGDTAAFERVQAAVRSIDSSPRDREPET
jgi:hypothetical protein